MLPVVIRYFVPEVGICNKLLEDAVETAESIVNHLEQSLQSASLSLDNLVFFTAENANVNYGRHGVFSLLQRKQSNLIAKHLSYIMLLNMHLFLCLLTLKHLYYEFIHTFQVRLKELLS